MFLFLKCSQGKCSQGKCSQGKCSQGKCSQGKLTKYLLADKGRFPETDNVRPSYILSRH